MELCLIEIRKLKPSYSIFLNFQNTTIFLIHKIFFPDEPTEAANRKPSMNALLVIY